MDKFFVDSTVGVNVWLEVENGIIEEIYGPSKESYISALKKEYLGKTISFFATDFVNKIFPSWHFVKPLALFYNFAERDAIESKIRFFKSWIENQSNRRTQESEDRENQLKTELERVEQDIKSTIERLKQKHNFDWDANIEFNNSNIEKRKHA